MPEAGVHNAKTDQRGDLIISPRWTVYDRDLHYSVPEGGDIKRAEERT